MAILYSSRMESLSFFEHQTGSPLLVSGWGINGGNAVTCCQAGTGGRTLPNLTSELPQGTIRWQYGYFCNRPADDFTRGIAEFNCVNGTIGSFSNGSFLSALDLNTDGSLTYRPNANLVTPVTFTSVPGVFLRDGTIQALQFRFVFTAHNTIVFDILINNVSVLSNTATAVGAINCTDGLGGPILSTPRWFRQTNSSDSATICDLRHTRTGINHYSIKHFRTGNPIIASSALVEVIIDDSNAPVSYLPTNAIPVIAEPCFVVAPPTTGTITVSKASTPDSGGRSFGFTAGGGLTPSTFSLTNGGNRTFTDVTPGVYSIVEDADPDWNSTYAISSGGTNNLNINVTAGSNIVVAVSNTPQPVVPAPGIGGIYFINPAKATRHDSYYGDVERKIPNPTVKTALIGE